MKRGSGLSTTPFFIGAIMIHMVQQFEFETDSLEDFERMLETIVHLEFRHQNSEYTKLHLKKKPPHWADGSEYKWTDRGIIGIGPSGAQKCFSIEPCATLAGAKQFKVLNQWTTLEEAAKEASHCERLPPTRLWVATLSDSACGFKKGEDHYCQTKSQMINKAIHAMHHADNAKIEAFGKLRTESWMEGGDGSLGMGYRIASEWDCGSRVLNLSLCHVYYGK